MANEDPLLFLLEGETKYGKALSYFLKKEGVYSLDPKDPGGETFLGISRRYNSKWEGWYIIDRAKREGKFLISSLTTIEIDKLRTLTYNFYKITYWNKVKGDQINSTKLAIKVMCTGVNLDPIESVEILQETINLLFLLPEEKTPLKVDGLIGDITLNEINSRLPDKLDRIMLTFSAIQASKYLFNCRKNPKGLGTMLYGLLKRAFSEIEIT